MTMRAEWLEPRIIHVAWPGHVTNDELAAVLADYTKLLVALGGPYASLLSTDGIPFVPPVQRQMLARWMDEQRYGSHRHCVGVAMVTTSVLTRGFMTAVIWLATLTPHYPIRTFGQRDEALSSLRDQLSLALGKQKTLP